MAILEDLDRRGILRRTTAGHVPGPRAATGIGRRRDVTAPVTRRRDRPGRRSLVAGSAGTSSPSPSTAVPLLDHAIDGGRRGRATEVLVVVAPDRDADGARPGPGRPRRVGVRRPARRRRRRPRARPSADIVLVVGGDMPAIVPAVLERLVAAHRRAAGVGRRGARVGDDRPARSRWRSDGRRPSRLRRVTARRRRAAASSAARGLRATTRPGARLAHARSGRRDPASTSTRRPTCRDRSRTHEDPRRRDGGRSCVGGRSARLREGSAPVRVVFELREDQGRTDRVPTTLAGGSRPPDAIRSRRLGLAGVGQAVAERLRSSRYSKCSLTCEDRVGVHVVSPFCCPDRFRCARRASPRAARRTPTSDPNPASSSVHARGRPLSRRARESSNTGTPPTNVPTTRASPIGPAPRSNRSRSMTARSASLPISIVPVSSSRWLT